MESRCRCKETGYDVPEVRDAVERQIASGVVHTSTLYLIRNQVELAEKIAKLSGIANAKVFFTNSGTEANETALLAALTAREADQVLAMAMDLLFHPKFNDQKLQLAKQQLATGIVRRNDDEGEIAGRELSANLVRSSKARIRMVLR